MSPWNKSNASMPDLELKLEVRGLEKSLNASTATSSVSPSSSCSCLSSEVDAEEAVLGSLGNGLEAKSMVLVGCQRCLIYVMLSDDRIRCPKCQSTDVLLVDIVKDRRRRRCKW